MVLAGKKVSSEWENVLSSPFSSQTFEVLFMMYVKNKTLNQGSWALKATLLLSRKHRNVIPAVKPHPLPSHHKFFTASSSLHTSTL